VAVPFSHVLARAVAALSLVAVLVGGTSLPAVAGNTEFGRIRSVALAQIGDPWVSGATGPDRFDCSGFVYFAFRQAGLLDRIGGSRRSAAGYWDWFADRGRASRTNAMRGDLVIWGSGRHIGIYLGDGKAISALTSGVKVHGLYNLTVSFTTFLHVRISR